jgi:drug/metabolite transporter (DMT)-like permease
MPTGPILSIFAALSFSVGIVIVRRASAAAGESFSVTVVSIFVGIPYFALAVTTAGDWSKVLTISWQALALLASAGVIHFIFGRLLGYSSYRLIGANKATPFIMTNRFYTVIFSFLFLGESITAFIVAGVLSMFLGTALTSWEEKSVAGAATWKGLSINMKGVLLALAAALCWGTTPVLIKPGVEDIGSSVAGAFVSYCAAAVVMLGLLTRKSLRRQVTHQSPVRSLLPMALAALFTSTGQMLYYTSLGLSPASVVAPLLSIQAIFIFFLSWLINRRSEVFSWKVALGMVATVVGTYLLFL